MCLALAVAWMREHSAAERSRDAAACWRRAAEEDRTPQARECPD